MLTFKAIIEDFRSCMYYPEGAIYSPRKLAELLRSKASTLIFLATQLEQLNDNKAEKL